MLPQTFNRSSVEETDAVRSTLGLQAAHAFELSNVRRRAAEDSGDVGGEQDLGGVHDVRIFTVRHGACLYEPVPET